MPSLRRTSSSPNVRSSPYGPQTRSSHPFRRSSGGSETTRRRVLADIDWWAVMDGQTTNHSIYPTTAVNDHNENHFFIPHHLPRQEDEQEFIPTNAEPVTRATTPVGLSVNSTRITLASPIFQFAELSFAPRAIPLNIRRHTFPIATSPTDSDHSTSSAGSSPDLLPVPLTPPSLPQTSPFILSFTDDYVPDFHGHNHTPPRLSLDCSCRSPSYSGYPMRDHDDIIGSIFTYHEGSGPFPSLADDGFH